MIKPFLQQLAENALQKKPGQLRERCYVFPNRRAGLFFSRYLAAASDKPVWSPHITTISELVASFSDLTVADSDLLSFELYKAYCSVVKEPETFDNFYFWGEMLTSDFDNIDKYLVDCAGLFSNIRDIHDIDMNFNSLTDEQAEIVREFWTNFGKGSMTAEKQCFADIWNSLFDIYTAFRSQLRRKGMAYEGMLFRDLAEMCNNGLLPDLKYTDYCFAGFNALNNCEKVFLKALKSRGCAAFYWDYDKAFILDKTHPAGHFLRQNIREFGDDLPGTAYTSSGSETRNMQIIDTASDIMQVKFASHLLSEMGDIDCDTAVVLADENLIVPLLTSLPANAETVNITMGYPLRYTPVYSLTRYLFRLAANARTSPSGTLFRTEDVLNVLTHNWIVPHTGYQVCFPGEKTANDLWTDCSVFADDAFLGSLFKKPETNSEASDWLRSILESLFRVSGKTENDDEENGDLLPLETRFRNEFIYRSCLAINRLKLIASDGVDFSVNTWFRLCEKILRAISVPFAGEPLSGLQIMGILETRALDFRKLVILSVNEGILPKSAVGTSVIPNNLREAYGLPAARHQDSIFAYYFYRLTGRAENITFIYNSSSSGSKAGEMSRYLLQLKYLSDNKPYEYSLASDISLPGRALRAVKRTEAHHNKLLECFTGPKARPLSPSGLNTWLNCRMKFWYRYVAGLKESDTPLVETDPVVFGRLLHKTMENIYRPYEGKVLSKNELSSIAQNPSAIELATKKAVSSLFGNEDHLETGGAGLLVRSVIERYAKSIINYDTLLEDLEIVALEKHFSAKFKTLAGEISVGGIIDRFDSTGLTGRIIDYKTGAVPDTVPSVNSLFDTENSSRSDEWFQVLAYCEIINRTMPGKVVRPGLYSVRRLYNASPGSDILKTGNKREGITEVLDYLTVRTEFSNRLEELTEQIFDRESHFEMTDITERCEWCPYKKMCQR
jgi:hypothetical protein